MVWILCNSREVTTWSPLKMKGLWRRVRGCECRSVFTTDQYLSLFMYFSCTHAPPPTLPHPWLWWTAGVKTNVWIGSWSQKQLFSVVQVLDKEQSRVQCSWGEQIQRRHIMLTFRFIILMCVCDYLKMLSRLVHYANLGHLDVTWLLDAVLQERERSSLCRRLFNFAELSHSHKYSRLTDSRKENLNRHRACPLKLQSNKGRVL